MNALQKIPVFRPPLPPGLSEALDDCLQSRWWGYGPVCSQLERVFTEHRGGWALATSSCTSALHIIARLLRRTGLEEVIVPAMTFVSTGMAFRAAGLQPVVADVESGSLMIDEASVEKLISERTCAVVAVHLYGQKKNLEALRAICDRHHIALIEDCAHAIGDFNQAPVGDFACYSFNAVKEAPAGEGGLLWGRNTSDEARAREISYLGMSVDTWQRAAESKHRSYEFGGGEGLKLRLTDIAATIVLACLSQLRVWEKRRKEIFDGYQTRLSWPQTASPLLRSSFDSYLMFVLRVPGTERERIRRLMAEAGVATSIHYVSLSNHPGWKRLDRMCPIAEQAETEVLTLPCFPELEDEEQRRVVDAWNSAWK